MAVEIHTDELMKRGQEFFFSHDGEPFKPVRVLHDCDITAKPLYGDSNGNIIPSWDASVERQAISFQVEGKRSLFDSLIGEVKIDTQKDKEKQIPVTFVVSNKPKWKYPRKAKKPADYHNRNTRGRRQHYRIWVHNTAGYCVHGVMRQNGKEVVVTGDIREQLADLCASRNFFSLGSKGDAFTKRSD